MKLRVRSLALLCSLSAFAVAAPMRRHATEEFKLLASDGAPGDHFGCSVSVDADTIVAGASQADAPGANSGAAYVFVDDGMSFVEQQKLVASDGAAGDRFGTAVAVFGDTAIVGAPAAAASGAGSGAAYVFVRSGSTWTQQQKLVPSTHLASDAFGSAVAIHADTVVVGSPRPGKGSAWVFTRTGTVWTEQDELRGSGESNGNKFGCAVTLWNDSIVVGASGQFGSAEQTGAAYAFSRTGGTWTEDQKLVASDAAPFAKFGASVAMSEGGVLCVGAPSDDVGGTDIGAAYRYEASGGAWVFDKKRQGLAAGDALGSSVAASFNFVLTGAIGFAGSGTAILWGFGDTGLKQIFVPETPSSLQALGESVSCGPCWMVAGAPGDSASGENAGAVFVFESFTGAARVHNGTGVNPTAMTTLEGPNIGQLWRVQIDTTGFPSVDATDIVISPRFTATPFGLPYGEALLFTLRHKRKLQPIGQQWPRMIASQSGSGLVVHEIPIPNDPYLIGTKAAVQGVLRSGGKIVALTNGELLVIGCFGQ